MYLLMSRAAFRLQYLVEFLTPIWIPFLLSGLFPITVRMGI